MGSVGRRRESCCWGGKGGQLDGLWRRGVWCVWGRDVKCTVGPLSRSPLINSLTRSLLPFPSRARYLPVWQNRPGLRKGDQPLRGLGADQGGQARLRGPPQGGDVSAATLQPCRHTAPRASLKTCPLLPHASCRRAWVGWSWAGWRPCGGHWRCARREAPLHPTARVTPPLFTVRPPLAPARWFPGHLPSYYATLPARANTSNSSS